MAAMDEQATNPIPKRRWLRFSLKWLFVVVTLMACISPHLENCYYKWKAERQHKADLDAINSVLGQEEMAIYSYATDEDWEQARRDHAEELRRLRDAWKKSRLKW